jgi:hypothetical protein
MNRLLTTTAVVVSVVATVVFAVNMLASAPTRVNQQQINPFDQFNYFQAFPNTLESAGVLLNYITFCRASVAPREHKFLLTLGFMKEKYGEEAIKNAATEVIQQQLQQGIFGTFCKRATDIFIKEGV